MTSSLRKKRRQKINNFLSYLEEICGPEKGRLLLSIDVNYLVVNSFATKE